MLHSMKGQFAEHLLGAGFVSSRNPQDPESNINSGTAGNTIYLYDCTEVSPYCLLFFGGDISIQKDNDQETIAVDEWIIFQSPARIAHLVKELRKELDILLQEKIESPHPVDWKDTKSRDCAVLSAIIDLIKTQETAAPRSLPPRFQDGSRS
ncbi:DHX36 [Cervus elaphus hippelaphus]|uniref:RNA helicase n=1 Tax=Cervus elaphus hippelaphus TaxID=46360 RepID=A0A212CJP4_CEREH|nr:DHX36 [Cervus elaphus hippelaphus]